MDSSGECPYYRIVDLHNFLCLARGATTKRDIWFLNKCINRRQDVGYFLYPAQRFFCGTPTS